MRGFPLEQAALKTQSSQGKEEGHGWWCCGSREEMVRRDGPVFARSHQSPRPDSTLVHGHAGHQTRDTRERCWFKSEPTAASTWRMLHGGGHKSRVDGHTRRCVWWEQEPKTARGGRVPQKKSCVEPKMRQSGRILIFVRIRPTLPNECVSAHVELSLCFFFFRNLVLSRLVLFWLKPFLFKAILLVRVDLFAFQSSFSVTWGHGQEPQMGSRGQHPGRRVEDDSARASSTLGQVGEAAQPVSRCSSGQGQEGFEEGREGLSPGATESQCAKSCANPAKIKPSVSSGGARCSSSQGPTVAGRDQRTGRCRHDREGESGMGFGARAVTSRGASRVGADHFYEGLHRAGEETVCLPPRRQ